MTTFLKLGGSVITDKARPKTPRLDTISRLASEIAQVYAQHTSLRVVLGHGSGSFGHSVAAEHNTHLGARTREDWLGFVDVWQAARALHTIILDELRAQGLPAVSFPPSASAISNGGHLVSIAAEPIQRALEAGLLPVVYGDVVIDRTLGTSIASTEAIFTLLTEHLKPDRLLLAGQAAGVYEDLDAIGAPLSEITPGIRSTLQFPAPEGEDVTGGMAGKVDLCLALADQYPDLEILIFSADKAGLLQKVLSGSTSGTRIKA